MSGAPFTHSLRVRFAECDPQGIVFNSRYLEYFDVALTELWREALGGYDGVMADNDVDLVVAEATLRYRAALRFDDVFEIGVRLTRLGPTSMSVAIDVSRDGEVIVEGQMRHVFVARETTAKVEIPAAIRTALQPYVTG